MDGILIGILYLVSLAFIITFFFVFLLNYRGPWGNLWAFFAIIFLAIFAADAWVGPVGPYFSDEIYWVPPLAVGLLFALILAATTPSPKTRSELEVEKKNMYRERQSPAALGIFFWFLFALLLLIVVGGLLNKYY